MRASFVTVNAMVLAVGVAAWRAGFFGAVPSLGWRELTMLVVLGVYSSIGFGAAFMGCFGTARHIANGVPMLALGCTGLGLLLAVNGLTTLTPEALAKVFRELAFAISPNIAGVVLMAWIREAMHWSAGEPI